jgi:putative hydrolase of the HAD superfamily
LADRSGGYRPKAAYVIYLNIWRNVQENEMKLRAVLFDLDDTLHDKSATLKIVADAQFLATDLEHYGVDRGTWQAAFIELNNLHIEKTEVF